MITDAIVYAMRCHPCDGHTNFIHQALEWYLHFTATIWLSEI